MPDALKVTGVTPVGRVSFPHVYQPHKHENAAEAKYELNLLFDKATVNLDTMKAHAKNAATEKFGDRVPTNLRSPFKDGDELNRDGEPKHPGCWYVRLSTKSRPGVVDKDKVEITEASGDFYAGCYARASYKAYGYDSSGNVGVSFGLNNLQKVADGEPFGGRTRAEDDFDAFSGSVPGAVESGMPF